MANQKFLNSRFSVRTSTLIGKYLPPRFGYKISNWIASLLSNRETLEITKSIRANQYVVNGEKNTKQELIQQSKNVLFHAGKSYYDFYHYIDKPTELIKLAPLSDSMKDFINLSKENQGYLVVAPHLSNFDLVLSVVVKNGFIGRVLSYPNPGSGYQLQNEIRSSYGLDLTPADKPNVNEEIIDYLKKGGIVATGVDRPLPSRKKRHYVNFFGRPSPLPLGYITTALAADVPIIVASAIMTVDGKYDFQFSGPYTLRKYNNKLDDIKQNAEMILKYVEEFIRMAPQQWLMYYPVWPDLMLEDL